MPKFSIKEKIFTFGDNFKIKDESENEAYQVIGKVISFGDQLSFQDMDGNQLFYVKEKPINLLKTYEIYKEGSDDLFLAVKKKLTLFKPKFEIKSNGPKYIVNGGVMEHDFTISRDGLVVATVNKKWPSFHDHYGVDILDGEDPATFLVICIVLDQALHD